MTKRSYFCGEVTEKAIGEKVHLKGWVQTRRDLGGLIFIDLRDRTGIVQVVFNPDLSKEALQTAEGIRSEFVLHVEGEVVARAANTVNENLATGKIEVHVQNVEVINKAKTPPFSIDNKVEVSEDVRLKYRYLDLRRPVMFETFKMRHQTTKAIRSFLDDQGFLDVETPMLTNDTPEGARSYLVPSRVHPGEFYALPQSPQLFKQLLMVGGIERYYQIARCFRDEDLRADRQPEFTQVDIEMSFLEIDDIIELGEQMMKKVMKEVKGLDIPTPFPRLSYEEAMNRFGSDKPDTRFEMEFINMGELASDCGFKVFKSAIENGGAVKALNVKGAASKYSRKDIDGLTEYAARYGAKGLAWLKVEDEIKGPIAKFFSDEEKEQIIKLAEAEQGDLLLFVADKSSVVASALGALRLKLGKDLELIDESKFNFLWVTDWPLLEYDEEEGRYFAAHHPFTMPVREDVEKLETAPEEVKAQAYDLVLNGYELGGGSLRIYERDLQEKMFKALGMKEEDAQEQFGFLMEAFEYGTPPHGGIALGLDRLVMLLAGRTNLRDTIAFPKTTSASCPLTNAPGPVNEAQLEELSLKSTAKKED
ncbi:aspartate--tRNA ligase [Priestia filamentosa]|uniref:Aspartate--tRNA ligase n=1 Tax=Priestia filamentosa TaxID=1402861 RepID=A0A1X7CV77_9BACI|nr:aspartate--tRNA ligase [Priestia filamentosa]AKO94248.1 aspartate--tRNA ligase [Priestia filamentosa]MDT3764523.1 aspartate--tRNA ligase [Priestia filamentosa]OXS71026.1 aspartate--tRNA ligase [Priestia filamentosa]WCM15135.1 aspartate--tRNA ligase [Priestia filamentosa]WRU94872.1 aspartate--tRNA ligase [Priestia filamentosa]